MIHTSRQLKDLIRNLAKSTMCQGDGSLDTLSLGAGQPALLHHTLFTTSALFPLRFRNSFSWCCL